MVKDLGIRGTMCIIKDSGEAKDLEGSGKLKGRAEQPCSGPLPWT